MMETYLIGQTYLRQGDIGNNDSVHGTGSGTERLVLVTVRMVLVLVNLTILRCGVPRHSTFTDANIAFGGNGGGLGAEVPKQSQTPTSANCTVESDLTSNWNGNDRKGHGDEVVATTGPVVAQG